MPSKLIVRTGTARFGVVSRHVPYIDKLHNHVSQTREEHLILDVIVLSPLRSLMLVAEGDMAQQVLS